MFHIVAMLLKPECVTLLWNNDIPLESTIQEVKQSLKTLWVGLQEIVIEIQHLSELLEAMKIKRQSIKKIINDHNIILSPVCLDVLNEIFFHCLPTYHNPIMTSSESPAYSHEYATHRELSHCLHLGYGQKSTYPF